MKKLIVISSMAATLLLPTITTADENTGVYITLGANHFIFDSERLLDDETNLFVGLGSQMTNHWSLGVEFTSLDTNRSWNNGPAFDTNFFSVVSHYRYQPRNEDSFFWKTGVGRYTEVPNSDDRLSARLGAGYDFAFSEKASFTLGADALVGLNKSRLDWVPYLAVNYFFGDTGSAPAPAPAPQPVKTVQNEPQDSDRDGVADNLDQCPNSRSGVSVDRKGCELDTDNDGVVNSLDQCQQTPMGAKVDASGCRIALKEDVSITLNVQFANNSNEITDAYRNDIKRVADFMRQYPDTRVTIEGHTDSRGSAQYNQQLSEKRAKAVMDYLIAEFSVAANRIRAVGKGEESPIASNDTAEGRKENRRVQAEIKTTVTKPQ
ncbi:OmpA family protein [Aliikangiella maris]|uniref:OmpA family protein n=2 Tax=Aliikangiella maris TaxID=3162458 RepID=A0ABV3MMV8_9GAMM